MTRSPKGFSRSGESHPVQPGGSAAWFRVSRLGRIAIWAVDCLLILALLVTGWRLVFVPSAKEPNEPLRQVRLQPLLDLGARLSTRIQSLENRGRSVVLMLDTRCPACEASRTFYRALTRAIAETAGTEFVVLVDEPVDEARAWLAVDGIVADEIIRLRSRAQAGFLGTPTLLVVDQNGVITDIANIALPPADEHRFIERVRQPTVGLPVRVGYFMLEFEVSAEPSILSDANLQLIDSRDRVAFLREHEARAINIPRDELLARSPAELVRALPVYVDCRHDDQRLCRIAGATLQDAEFADIRVLLR